MSNRYIELYIPYLAAFNDHSLSAIETFLSPKCTADFRDTKILKDRSEMLPTYPAHWAKQTKPIEIREIHGIADGIWVILRDWDAGHDVEVEYHFDGDDLQIWHDIKRTIPFEKEV